MCKLSFIIIQCTFLYILGDIRANERYVNYPHNQFITKISSHSQQLVTVLDYSRGPTPHVQRPAARINVIEDLRNPINRIDFYREALLFPRKRTSLEDTAMSPDTCVSNVHKLFLVTSNF